MRSLIILAHPAKKSFNSEIAKAYSKKMKDAGHETELINLYSKKYSQAFLEFDSISDIPKDKVRDMLQKKMKKADEYVFVFPVWWGGVPAILKNFFDNNLSSGFAFKYDKTGKLNKLLDSKTAKVFCTCDAPGIVYRISLILGISIKNYLSKAILGYCGIKLVNFNMYSSLRKKSKAQKKDILKSI